MEDLPNFSSLVSPLNDLVKKEVTFHWEKSKKKLPKNKVLAH